MLKFGVGFGRFREKFSCCRLLGERRQMYNRLRPVGDFSKAMEYNTVARPWLVSDFG